jgi:hypothetical protein
VGGGGAWAGACRQAGWLLAGSSMPKQQPCMRRSQLSMSSKNGTGSYIMSAEGRGERGGIRWGPEVAQRGTAGCNT